MQSCSPEHNVSLFAYHVNGNRRSQHASHVNKLISIEAFVLSFTMICIYHTDYTCCGIMPAHATTEGGLLPAPMGYTEVLATSGLHPPSLRPLVYLHRQTRNLYKSKMGVWMTPTRAKLHEEDQVSENDSQHSQDKVGAPFRFLLLSHSFLLSEECLNTPLTFSRHRQTSTLASQPPQKSRSTENYTSNCSGL
jgi:hypothetical protein